LTHGTLIRVIAARDISLLKVNLADRLVRERKRKAPA